MTQIMNVNGKFTDIISYVKNILFLMVLMAFGATSVWAQTDYSGVYCLANNNQGNFLGNGNDGNFYLCPSQEYYDAGSVSTTDNGKPFFTTYQTKQDANSLWVFEKVDGQNYYTIKLYGTNKYITVNDALTGYGKAHRKRIHLEELAELSDRNYFEITPIHVIDGVSGVSISCLDKYKSGNNKYFNPASGNQPSYTSTNNKETPWSGGMVGFYTIGKSTGDDRGSVWFLEIPKPTITYDDETGNVTITAIEGTTIHYEFDGTSPTGISTTYSVPISMAGHTSIKAIAVRTSDSKVSGVATMDMIDFTYHILTLDKTVAAQATKKQPAGMPFSGYINLPAAIQSPYISDETLTFYTMEGDYVPANINKEHLITATPANSANIYVTYTTDKLGQKFLHFQGARPFNFKNSSGQYLYDNGTAVVAETNAETNAEEYVTEKNYLWYFYGSDPYNIQIRNANSNKYLTISGSTPARSDDAVPFFLTEQSGEGTTSRHITLKNVSNGETIELNINTVVLPLSYTLIDRKNNVIERNIAYNDADGWGLPDAWKSPVVDYHYWNADAFVQTVVSGTPDEPFVFNGTPTEITSATQATSNNVIYVTYTLKDDISIDLDGRDLLNNREGALGATYRLKFTGGVNFNQENGKDGILSTPTKAVYPYSNGDASLYVYGEDQWTTQLASGASTRSRWLWYLEPAKDVLDPYHVRVSSYQSQTNYKDPTTNEVVTNFHSYLRTYKPEGYSGVVTGVTNNNPEAQGKTASATAETNLPEGSEYMLLGTDLSNLKLVTVDAIDGSRRTVNSFEQYWKNNPTVQGKLPEDKKVTSAGRNVTLSDDQKTKIASFDTDIPWHVYKEFANSAPWMHNNDANHTTSKKFLKEEHAYQTISMGETFSLVETTIDPMLILLDQHGWEIARIKLPTGNPSTLTPEQKEERKARYAAIHKYSSPMVKAYHYYKTASKEPGYHKYKVDLTSHATEKNDPTKEYTSVALGVLVGDVGNLPDYGTQALVGGKERDWYVTYDVKDEYTSAYTGAATEDGTSSVPYLVKQGGEYAKINGTSLETEETEPNIENVPQELRWYVKPNFDIDEEMGYLYEGETGAQEEAESKYATEAAYYAAGKNGFDPYNVQIQSVSNTERYFTADTEGSTVTSSWAGTSSSISLENMGVKQSNIMGLDQTHMKITNATFMVLDDGNGNMRLVPRFDNTKVMQNFTTLAAPGEAAAVDDKGASNQTIFLTKVPEVVNNSTEITVMGGTYLLSSTFSASGSIGTKDAPFIGTIEGQIGHSFDISAPLIAYADGAVIKNVIIDNANSISGDTIGAIVATANGATRIYNCGVNGGSVSGSVYSGGIVGLLNDSSRVINCYSYADVGGGTGGGIVGYNSHASNSTDLKTMVMNCMFYGNMTSTSKAPIYNGEIISNKDASGLSNYNYFLAEKPYVQNNQITTYNCALMAETRFLQRFEFYRMLLNSHLELAGWYATGEYKKDEMMKWVLETADRNNDNPKPYPVLKARGQYPSIINFDAAHAPTTGDLNTGKELGTLSVTISGVGSGAVYSAPTGASITTSSLSLPITDKDYERFNFNYGKVQLPYYNDVGTGNYTKASDGTSRVVTGWKITSISGGTNSYSTDNDGDANTPADATASVDENGNITLTTPYNFADRKCTDKDKYDVSGRVFNQGAYWDVPEGVTSITIEPYWAKCVYVSDAYPDVVYNQEMGTAYKITTVGTVGGAARYTNGQSYSINGDNQVVYTTMGNAAGQMPKSGTVYDNAIVLVGNVHSLDVSNKDKNRPYTIMSIDLDKDNEPDYSYILRYNSRVRVHPVRVDFLNIPGLGMAQKSTGGKGTYNLGILQPLGWFESTNTSLFRFTQFEYDKSGRVSSPMILHGGVIEQWVTVGGKETELKEGKTVSYYHVGGNVWFKEFHIGVHQDKTQDEFVSPHPPISVTGGDFDEFYLTGLYNTPNANYDDNAECYINGGRFGKVAGTGIQGIGSATNHTNGNIIWQIDNADIDEFYAGGINAAHIAEGNIYTVISNSRVDQFCGGPKFGDMNSTKKVVTNADNCTFRAFFGAGYGGNSYNRKYPYNQNNVININWNTWVNTEYKQEYDAAYKGVATRIDYQFLPMSNNTQNVARLCIDYVNFSLATTYDVTSKLTDCTITTNSLGRLSIAEDYKCLGNFYGGGSLGKVNGPVKSILTNCKIEGNVFGAGYSASLPTVEVDSVGFRTAPKYYEQAGTFAAGVKGATTTYRWQHADAISIDKDNKILYTTEDLTGLGAVTGTVTLTVDGNTVVGDDANENSGNVYGGGESSDATSDVNVHILNGTMTDVYGGGKGQTTVVGGDVIVNIGAKSGEGALSGSGTVNGNVYGGSALGVVNAISTKDGNGDITAYTPTPNKTSHVNIYKGTVTGSVFGGGLGQLASAEPVQAAIAAQNFGNAIISMEGGSVGDAIYGGANANGVLKADAEVTLLGGMIGDSHDTSKDVVFGGGKGEPTLVNGNVTVNVGTKSDDPTPVHAGTAMIYGNVYGGSALGHTNATSNVDFNTSATTNVNLYSGTINGYVFGGGLGRKYKAAVAQQGTEGQSGYVPAQSEVTAVESFVGGDVTVLLDGAKVRQVFGCNNLNGTPKGHVLVHVMLTNNFSGNNDYKNNSETALDARTTYDVEAVYGGGNKADYNPTKATDPDENVKKQAFAEVLIEGCDSTSIEYVYGGGNAAAVPADSITVKSVYIIGQLFGGGNGAGADNPGADVGVIDRDAYAADKSTGIYGTGIAKTKLIGGQIRYVYGGSNTKGNVRGGTSLERKESNTHCALKIKEIYGAGQLAPMDGDVIIKLDCMPEDFVSQVFGGAKNATINGKVSLTVSSGKFGRVFGGNNLGGSINGSIEVNAYEDGCKPLIIGELYGGGFNAPYSIWGCNDSDNDGTWTPNTPAGDPHVAADADAISVNVYSCTSIGKVFGGGFGATANVVGNTHVWINTMQGIVDGKMQTYGEGVYIGKIGQVFGGGNAAPVKGDVTIDIGTATVYGDEKIGIRIINGTDYLKTTTDADTTITAGIYGGGNAADVDGNVTMNIGTVSQNQGINIGGDIYGGGYGETTHVTGNVTVNIGKKESETPVGYANITGDVYGGSAKGKVNTADGSTTNKYKPNPAEETTADCYTHVNFYGGTIQDTETPGGKGNIYGGGLGEDNEGTENDHAADVFGPVTVTLEKGSTTNTVVNNVFGCNNVLGTPKKAVTVNVNGGTVNHSVYGGGNQAAYTPSESQNYPAVNVTNGTVTENVFGGGLGLTATVTANPHVTIGNNVEGDTVRIKKSVYGGGSLAGVNGNTNIVVNSGTIGTEGEGGATYGNIYGGGFGTMSTSEMTEAQAVKEAGIVKGNTAITVNGGNVLHNIYGGGAYGSVGTYTYDASNVITGYTSGGVATINILGGTIGTNGHENGMIFGASRGDVGATGSIHDKLAWVYDTNVTIGDNDEETPDPQVNGSLYGSGENGHTYRNAAVTIHSGKIGITDTSIDGGAAYAYRGNVYGGGCGTDKYDSDDDSTLDAYNSKAGIVGGNATVTIDGGHVVRNVYGAGAMGSVTGKTTVNISGKSVIGADGSGGGYVYAAARGSEDMADGYATVGSTELNISGGTIWGSAFGGGQLGTVKGNVAVTVSGGVVKNDVYGGGALANTNTDNWNTSGSAFEYVEVTPAPTVGTTPVGGYYTRTGSDPNYVYTLVTSGSAAGGTTYYKKKVVGDWAATHPYKTTVVLTGGVIGNAYGGGLGSSTVAANVYGDVKVTVNKPSELTRTGGSGIAFTRNTVNVTYGTGDKKKEYVIPLTGRVFGCNNINGTPTGNVGVEVYGTRQIEISGQSSYTLYPISGEGSEHSPNSHNKYYEVQAVYGGGNLSDYLPAAENADSVYITGCDSTSIEKVYGGGNSAIVPSSKVVINGSFDIGTAFGGGNGGDLVQKDGVWYENDGAIVIGKALMKPKGGKVGEVFGGSDAKGFCGNPVIDKTEHNNDCPLVTTRMYGAGKESDVDHVDIVISGCTAGNTEIEYVFGGSYNAHIAHDINLTITAGVFKNVFGGNDRTGSIGGDITVNIEETEDCEKPLIIQNLFGGGNEAAYPGTKRDGTEITTPGKITVNVKSATRIDNVFGGSFKADVNGNTEVNINMTKGFWAGKTYQGNHIPDSVGVIGNIYGGGNQGVVRGNSKVNICTADSVGYKTIPAHLTYREKDGLYYVPVTGARITGEVFGGGNEANVNGNDTVNICTADYSGISGFQGVSIGKTVYGGGYLGDVLGNTYVKMSGGYVFNGVFGGGYAGSVGTFTRRTEAEYTGVYGHTAHAGCIGKPVSCAENTGKCTVVVNGGQIGPFTVATQGMNRSAAEGGPVVEGWIWGGSQGLIQDPDEHPDTHFLSYVGSTDVTVGGTALIMESIIGGGEFGRVLGNTLVKIEGGQIGIGENMVDNNDQPIRYTDDQFVDPLTTVITKSNALKECSHFPYGTDTNGDGIPDQFLPYDPYYDEYPTYIAAHPEFGHASTANPSDGKTWIGCVFGGGSGYMPYKKRDGSGYDWCRSAGLVEGDTEVRISGGHILTNVYGANEITDVKGKSIIRMTGGTIGVPRTEAQIAEHPLTCYLFGGGKGDERPRFYDFNTVDSVRVDISGGIIYGSVFGGAEDGHVLGDISLTIRKGENFTIGSTTYTNGPIIGTWGTTYVEGNVFGGGRGFSGETLTAGSTGGNVTMTINGGTMRGSVYGGGRLASVGIGLNPPEHLYYGQLKDETGGNGNPTYGHVTINISGGQIGNGTTEAGTGHPVSGNVFGGSMGRITMLDGKTRIPLWPKQAVTKLSNVTISGGEIWNSVYGGGEIGIVRNRATVNVSGGTIHGNVFGGGYGSNELDPTTITAGGYDDIPTVYYTFTPMMWTGCVAGDTYVNISGGKVEKNVYGGGNYASVGLMNYNSNEDGTVYNNIKKHDTTNGFGLSWPYEFQYIKAAPTDGAPGGNAIGGKTTINITGGHIGSSTWNDGTGYVFGGSKGMVDFGITSVSDQRYTEAFCANVRETEVNVNYTSTPTGKTSTTIGAEAHCIMGAVYGGGEDGHVYENAAVNITNGLIGLSVYGAGKGISTYQGYLRDESTKEYKNTKDDLYSWTAGKVYGNTTVTMTNGHVLNNVYGGGYLGSVGKGNYSGGADDYFPSGYGETLTGNLWTSASEGDDAWEFLHSGKATVKIEGGTVGTLNGTYGSVGGDDSMATPTGMVFGGSRGQAAEDIMLDPRYEYAPNFYLGYVNETEVTIGTESSGGPRIFGQVFGGGRDGHVRGSAHVIVNDGTIGQTYAETAAAGGKDAEYHRYHRGNVYGAGSGLGLWATGKHGMSSGSITNKTTVDINGGIIYNNVYGGGAMACVGPPKINQDDYATASLSKCTVNINGGTIGDPAVYDTYKYGGTIYGGSRGDRGGDLASGETIENYATVLWTEVNINPHPTDRTKDAVIAGNVYGGARGGQVKKDTKVNLTGGVIKHNAYGGGRGTTIPADVLGNTTTELNKGVAADGSKKGCIVDKVFGCNDLNGTPKGHVLVHVYGTQNRGTANMSTKVGPGSRTSLDKGESEGYIVYMNRLIALAKNEGVVKPGITESVITAAQATITGKEEASLTDGEKTAISNAAKNVITELQKLQGYDVTAVYGGGDLAPYVPTVSEDNTVVIIEGCDVTSIKQVYGGGNAAYVPATNVLVKSAYVIDELFGGGNGLDNYKKDTDGKWYENPGANVGYTELEEYAGGGTGTEGDPYKSTVKTDPDATTKEGRIANYSIGTGVASTTVNGGYIHHLYGGSNEKGNIRREALLTVQQVGACALIVDETTAGSKSALIDAETNTVLDCVREGGEFYAGSTSADILNDVHVRITNGKYTKVFGGNKKAGTITGSITIDIEENGCTPIEIDELYAGGYLAPYSVYGYSATTRPVVDENGNAVYINDNPANGQMLQRIPYKKGDVGALATPSRDPQINIISATKIGKIYGGGYAAELIGSPHINVNMTTGRIRAKYASEYPKTGYEFITNDDAEGNKIIPVGVIGTIFGGGNKGDIYGDTYVEIGTGKHHTFTGEEETITPSRNKAFVLRDGTGGQVFGGGDQGYVFGNTNVNIGNGYIYDRVYGGGNEGTVGTVSSRAALPAGHASHANCLNGKPTAFATGTGKTTVTVSGGYVGPYSYVRSASTGTATPTPMTMPQDYGYVFAAGRGKMGNPDTAGNEDIEFMTYVDSTVVTIKNTYEEAFEGDSLAHIVRSPLIAGGVYGGSENGRVLHNTHVNIWGGQIGLGAGQTTAYAESAFIDPTTATAEEIATKAAAMPECTSWAYGHDSNSDSKNDEWLPYDEHAGNGHYQTEAYGAASTTGYDGHTFYGNVFGGGSGYFAYETDTEGVYEWLPSAGLVEGDTYVNISGGHILTNVYGGNEMTNVTGTAHVTMTGGTLGVPRTLAQIAEHPVTCYLFGAGKGDQRVHFNKSTNVGHAVVNVSGGIIYGSVFGGGEDGHVLGDVTMNISDGAKIGTWGTSYVDGNVFGGGRGFGGDAYTAGNVAGSVTLNITGGTMLGSVYGGGRLGSVGYGLFSKDETEGYGKMMADNATETGFVPVGGLTHGRGHVVVNISGDNTVIGNKYEYQNVPTDVADLDTWKTANHVPQTAYETTTKTVDATTQYIHRLKHTRGGNVFAGGMGRYTLLDGTPISAYDGSGNLTSPIEWKKLGNVKSTKLTISGNPWIMGNVYGGGELGSVLGSHNVLDESGNPVIVDENNVVTGTEIIVKGGTIGTEVTGETPVKAVDVPATYPTEGNSAVKYTYGSVYGGGEGREEHDTSKDENHGGNVISNARVNISGTTKVRASVFGGGELALVGGDTYVNIIGGEIGRNEVKALNDANAGYVMFGGATMGNVYGGGKGSLGHFHTGQVKGNTNVNITGGNVYHMVYGGGALGSVGTFQLSTGSTPAYIPYAGVPYNWTAGTGTATVTITGGTIGISGRDNGLVFGSSRGGLKAPEDGIDPYDRVAWVNKSVVNIGTEGSGSVYTTPLIKGSVYGGGENGHNADSAIVNIYSGTIGVVDKIPGTETADPWWDFGNEDKNTEYRGNRGNVYGAGSGADTYTGDDDKEYYNPKSGMVGTNTVVNIYGGHVGRNVYGGGSMSMVGTITNVNDTTAVDKGGTGTARHTSETTSFALSWPYKFVFKENTGKATVNVTGGHIGTLNTDGGDVFGSSRGEAGDRYTTAHLAYVKETEVNVSYPAPVSIAPATTVYEYYASLMPTIKTNFDIPCITGSVSGSGENGYVYGDTHVTLNKGLIGHSLYGGGKGKGTYTKKLNKIGGGGTYDAKIYSLIAGKVLGNTYVTMNDGYVGRNVYGGGNMASVGKGSYASGADDYYPAGYGEKITGNLWSSAADGDDAWEFLNSGKTTVNVISGNVGYIDKNTPANSMKNELPYGNVIGGSAGEAAPNLPADLLENRYLYSPAFYSGYVNETDVTIGGYRCKTAYTGHAVGELITANDFKDVADGDTAKWQLVGPTIIANVYGGGQDGHVRRDTKVTVLSGEIGRPYNSDNVDILGNLQLGNGSLNPQWLHRGNVYGGGSGITQYNYDFNYDGDTADANEQDYSSSSGSVSRFTEVNVLGGIVHRNVYGGGSLGSVGAPDLGQEYDPYKKDLSEGNKANWGKQSQCTVNISGQIGTVISSRSHYGGDVFGACRGNTSLNANEFGTAVWTRVSILDGATIFGNVFGGGDAGIVRKNAEVIIGDNAE